MSLQTTETVSIGSLLVTKKRTSVVHVDNITTGVLTIVQEVEQNLVGIAYIALPDSSIDRREEIDKPAKYADTGIPCLLQQFQAEGGNLKHAQFHLVGGSQLFNFGGGGGNLLNMPTRTISAIKTQLLQDGYQVHTRETGGNKSRSIKILIASTHIFVRHPGQEEHLLLPD
jgi:chemotaxis protein CheD